MKQYLLVLFDDPSAGGDISPAEIQAVITEYHAWGERLKQQNRHVGGEKLCDEGGRRMQLSGDDLSVTDGPYSETKEVIGGYYVIRAESYDDAVAMCRDHPHLKYGLRMEVRQIEDLG